MQCKFCATVGDLKGVSDSGGPAVAVVDATPRLEAEVVVAAPVVNDIKERE
jgi:hypothetical protein